MSRDFSNNDHFIGDWVPSWACHGDTIYMLLFQPITLWLVVVGGASVTHHKHRGGNLLCSRMHKDPPQNMLSESQKELHPRRDPKNSGIPSFYAHRWISSIVLLGAHNLLVTCGCAQFPTDMGAWGHRQLVRNGSWKFIPKERTRKLMHAPHALGNSRKEPWN